MQFVTALALLVAALVAAPYVAHRLRRQRAEERDFAAARLVPPAPPKARRRAQLEDKGLFAIRALAVVALALLGASPLVRCSRLALQRSGGASVGLAIVVDDSMSMRAPAGDQTRFARAVAGARELLASARDGDAVAIVLAGAPSRVALAATTDLGAARAALERVTPSDRATDLDGAVTMARALIAQLPQIDRRVVVMSDLADGNPEGRPLGEGIDVPVWIPLAELREPAVDCGVVAAQRSGARVEVRLACSPGASASGREVLVVEGDRVLTRAPAPGGAQADVSLALPAQEPGDLVAKLSGTDAIAADDAAPVVVEAGPGSIGVVGDTTEEHAATGGAPIVEQALAALHLAIAVRPIPQVPDRADDLSPFAGLVLDDPPGLTPEQRKALGAFVAGGGVALLALGPRAAAAPLGATLEPLLARSVAWGVTSSTGASVAGASGPLAEAAATLVDLSPHGRATLAPEDLGALEPLVAWKDGAPLVARRPMGRGEAWIVTLPFSVNASDLTLRPGFLGLLDAWAAEARARATPRRGEVGGAWTFPGASSVAVDGPSGPLPVTREGGTPRAVPPVLGAYRITVDGKKELRVATFNPRELDLRPRAAAAGALTSTVGDRRAVVDVSWAVALVLLALVAAELGLRALARGRANEGS